jgi:hypothetical protein
MLGPVNDSDATGPRPAVVGVADHSGWANFVTIGVGAGGAPVLLDRRRCELVGADVDRQPYHAAVGLDDAAAEALVAGVADAALAGAREVLAALAEDLAPDHRVAAVAVRLGGGRELPDTVAGVLASHSAMHAAEGELYREALADAAEALGIPAVHYRRGAPAGAHADTIAAMGRAAGPPWRAEHKEAAAAALTELASGG